MIIYKNHIQLIKGEFIITFHGKTSDDVEKISTAVFKRKNFSVC